MKVGNEKILGGLGGIFLFLLFVPGIGILLGLAGYVLFLIAMYEISKVYNDQKIFNWSLMGVILSTLGLIFVIFYELLFGAAGLLGTLLGSNLMENVLVFVISIGPIMDIIVAIVLFVYAYYLLYKALKKVAEYTQISMFKLAGQLLFMGSILIFIFIGIR
ncbi:DUF996 domain-containing protein [Calditerrivibrio sp.]|uniref:DUF996 domain-containing protein n=1 Tax=Calditerrivibrio sp. TaxID=2792612 RepID=UPI003D0D6C6C